MLLLNRVFAEDGTRDKRRVDLAVAKWKGGRVGMTRVEVEAHKDRLQG